MSTKRRGTAFILGILALSSSAAFAAPAQPNVLLIVMDDQGYGDSSCYGAKDVRTPRFDALAASGVRFTKFRVNPLCAPTRACLLSGLSSLETGMWRGPSQNDSVERSLHDDLKLLPQLLREKGYATGIFGKWHLGYKPPNVPTQRGFDEFVGFLGGSHPYSAHRGAPIVKDGNPYTSDAHLTDLFADHAEDFIRRHKDAPFFCYLPFNAVHGPLRSAERPANSAKPEWLAKYENLPPDRRDYCAVLSHADERVGRLLDLLKELGVDRNTLIICLSDNGAMTDKYPGSNGPLRGAKGTTYEGGIRVPAAMSWPEMIPAGIVSHADAAHFDIFSTILHAAGIPPPTTNGKSPVQGLSLLSHVRSGGQTPLPKRYLFWDLYGKMAAVHGDWKIVGTIDNHHGKFDRALEEIEKTKFELYNLSADLGEQQDVAEKHPEIYRDLKQRYLAWFKSATR